MTYPTTGPVETYIQMGSPPSRSVYDKKWKYKQALPYDLELPYFRNIRYVSAVSVTGKYPSASILFDANVNGSYSDMLPLRFNDSRVVAGIADALNKARADFFAQLGDNPNIVQTIAEWQQTANMAGGVLLSIARSANQLRRGNIYGAAKALSPSLAHPSYGPWIKKWSKRSYRTIPKWFGSAWLELHFGWVPLAQDAYNLFEMFNFSRPEGKISGRAKIKRPFTYFERAYVSGAYEDYKGEHTVVYTCRMSADWQLSNPGLYLLNRSGVLNPLSVAWELVPFSFVVDWFTNVGQAIASATDYAGLTFRNSSHTVMMRDDCFSSMESYWYEAPAGWFLASANRAKTMELYVERKLGIPNVALRVPPLKRISFVRAATAIALLLNGLSK